MKKSTLYITLAAALSAANLSGCYVLPVGSDDVARIEALVRQAQQLPSQNQRPLAGTAPATIAVQGATANPTNSPTPSAPLVVQARLYPINDIATENGMVSGTVTNMMNGKGRLQLTYRGEPLTGEATRVANDERKGVASAWGPNGSFMTCEYQMSSPLHGAGTCNFSDGARYQVHVGN